jgi:hypothetical protein
MMRAVLCILALAASACASHNNPAKIEAWCSRYAAKHMALGVHADLNAYREDLMSSCMAMKGVPYAKAPARGGAQQSAN